VEEAIRAHRGDDDAKDFLNAFVQRGLATVVVVCAGGGFGVMGYIADSTPLTAPGGDA
jgi:predicted Rossmann-fold nucleotide-binding protein